MCSHFQMRARAAQLAARYRLRAPADLPPVDDDLFPTREAWVVRGAGEERTLAALRWGVPARVRDARGRAVEKPVTNVRNLASPFWREALARPERRCLVPFTRFSEYGPGPAGARPKYWFDVPSRAIASFAGVWRRTEAGDTFAFLTCAPNALVEPIHPKAMPVVLHEEDEGRWLSAPRDEALALVAPFPSQLMGCMLDPATPPPEPPRQAGLFD